MYTGRVPDKHAGVTLPGSLAVYMEILRATNSNNNALSNTDDEGNADTPGRRDAGIRHSSTRLSLVRLDKELPPKTETPMPTVQTTDVKLHAGLTIPQPPSSPKEAKWRSINIRPTPMKMTHKPRPPTARPVNNDKLRHLEALAKCDDPIIIATQLLPKLETPMPTIQTTDLKADALSSPKEAKWKSINIRQIKQKTAHKPRPPTARPPNDDKLRPLEALAKVDDPITIARELPPKTETPMPTVQTTALKPDADLIIPQPPSSPKEAKWRSINIRPTTEKMTAMPRPPTARHIKGDKARPLEAVAKHDEQPDVANQVKYMPTPPNIEKRYNRPAVKTKCTSQFAAKETRVVSPKLWKNEEPADILVITDDTPTSEETELTPTMTPTNEDLRPKITDTTPEEKAIKVETEKPARKKFGPSDYEVVRSTTKKPAVFAAREKISAILAAARARVGVADSEEDISVAQGDKNTDKDNKDVLCDGGDADKDKDTAAEADAQHEKYSPDKDVTAYMERVPVDVLVLEYRRWRAMLDDIKLKMDIDEKIVDRHWEWYTDVQGELEVTMGEIVKHIQATMAAMVELDRATAKANDLEDANDRQGALNAEEEAQIVTIIKRTNVEDDMLQAYKQDRLDELIRRIRGKDTLDAMHEALKMSQKLNTTRDQYHELMLAEAELDPNSIDDDIELSETSDIEEDAEDDTVLTPGRPTKPVLDSMATMTTHSLAEGSGLDKFMKYRQEMEANLKARKLRMGQSSSASFTDVIHNGEDGIDIIQIAIDDKGTVGTKMKMGKINNGGNLPKRNTRGSDILIMHSPGTSQSTMECTGVKEIKNPKVQINNVARSTISSKAKANKSKNTIKTININSCLDEIDTYGSRWAPSRPLNPTIKLPQIHKRSTTTNDTHKSRVTHEGGIPQAPTATGCLLPSIPTAGKCQEHRPTTGRKDGPRRRTTDSADVKLPPIQKPRASSRRRR